MCHVVNAALAAERLERAIEHIQMFGLEPASTGFPVLLDVLDGVKFFNVGNDVFHLVRRVAQPRQCVGHGAVHDLQRPAAGEQLVLHQRDVRLDAGRVAVHEKRDRAGRRQHGDLRVAVAVLAALGQGRLPTVAGGVFQVSKILAWLDVLHGGVVQFHDAAHRLDVVLGQRLGHVIATGIAITGERAFHAGQLRRLLVRMAGHDRRDRAGQGAALVRVVRQPVAHDQRAQVGEAEAKRAENVRVLGDRLGRVTGVVDENFLRGDENAHRRLEAVDVEHAVLELETHQVQRGQIAGGVVDEHVLGAGVGRVNRLGAAAGVPLLDRAIVLEAGVAAHPRALGDFIQQPCGIFLFKFLAGGHSARPPIATIL